MVSPTAFLLLTEVVITLTEAISLFKTSNSVKIPPKMGSFADAIYYTLVLKNCMSRSNNSTVFHTYKIIPFFIFLFLLFHVYGEAQSKIHGTVTGDNAQPLQNANVLLLNAKDSSLVKGIITPQAGSFSFDHIAAAGILSPLLILVCVSFLLLLSVLPETRTTWQSVPLN